MDDRENRLTGDIPEDEAFEFYVECVVLEVIWKTGKSLNVDGLLDAFEIFFERYLSGDRDATMPHKVADEIIRQMRWKTQDETPSFRHGHDD